jgi:hypothetical protein
MLLVLALVGGALLVIVAGCGSDDVTEGRTLTKKQFVHLTQAFCNREYRPEERDMEKYADEHGLLFGGGEPWEQEVLTEVVVFDYVRDKIAYFKSLPVPEGDEKQVRQMIEAFEEGLEKSEADPALLAEPRPGKELPSEPFEKSYETTERYGPWLCAQP